MKSMASLAATLNGSTAELSAGDGVTGILVMQRAEVAVDMEAVSFALSTPNSTINVGAFALIWHIYIYCVSNTMKYMTQQHSHCRD